MPRSRWSRSRALVALLAAFAASAALAQPPADAPTPRPFRIVKHAAELDDLIAADAKLELVGDRFGLTEGPVWVPAGTTATCCSAI